MSLSRSVTELINTYLTILQEMSQVLLFVWVGHTFSGFLSITWLFSSWHIFSSTVSYIVADAGQSTDSYTSSESTSLLVSPSRQDVGEGVVVVSVWLIYLVSHTFSLDDRLLTTQTPGEILCAEKNSPDIYRSARNLSHKISFKHCLKENGTQCVRDETWGWGDWWLVLPSAD